ncbi:EAL domain-containing protein, partial [Rhizobium ruizarguesonis]
LAFPFVTSKIGWYTSEKARAVEALMRLRMPDGTEVSPKTFIPVAERSGAILELGKWEIETACRDILMTDRMASVSVNVSP